MLRITQCVPIVFHLIKTYNYSIINLKFYQHRNIYFKMYFQNPKLFTADLLNNLHSQSQYLHSLMTLQSSGVKTETNPARLQDVEMALEALRNVVKNNPGSIFLCFAILAMWSYFVESFLMYLTNAAKKDFCIN